MATLAAALTIAMSPTGCGASHNSGVPPVVTDSSGLPVNRGVTRAELNRFPEAHLRFPGSVPVKLVGMDQTPTHPGEEPNAAFTGAILTASTTPAALYSWYGSVLSREGFSPALDFRLADQMSGEAWQLHHRLEVQIGVFDPSQLRQDSGVAVQLGPGDLVYEAVLVGYPPGLPKY